MLSGRSYARTLARLATADTFHRDLKPENLFRLGDEWVIGDFGLVTYPGKEEMTVGADKLGPMYYIAPEMLNSPGTAKPGPADVYSLAKTLWVLASGQTYPLPAPIVPEDSLRLSSLVSHPRAHLLESLLSISTDNSPTRRPSMAEFSAELDAWPTPLPPVTDDTDDMSDLGQRIGAATQPAHLLKVELTRFR